MKIFDLILDEDFKCSFIEKKLAKYEKWGDDEILDLCIYVKSQKCNNDIVALKNKNYFTEIPKRFYIKKSRSDQRRVCYKFEPRDKYLFKLMSNALMFYDNLYVNSLYSYRKTINYKDFFKKAKKIDFNREHYVLKMDIHRYGESLDQDILLDTIKPILKNDEDFYLYLKWLFSRNMYYEKGKLHKERISIQPGIPLGGFMNNVYLMDLDYYIEQNSILYMRYSDDIVIYLDSYDKCIHMKNYITSVLSEKKLTLNEKKCCIYKPGEPFEVLGIKISPNGHYDIASNSIKKITHKIDHKCNKLLRKTRQKVLSKSQAYAIFQKYINKYFYGCFKKNELNWVSWSFKIITTTETLKYLDNFIQERLRMLASGKKSKARYRICYNYLKDHGYISLVHSYYHGYDKEVDKYLKLNDLHSC